MTDDDGTFKKPSADLAPLLVKARKPELPPGTSKVADIPEAASKEQPQQLTGGDGNEIPPVPYREPAWSQKCDPALNYGFEVLKNGVIIEEVKQLQNKPFWLFGRLPNCDINMAHPTISRYHAILQYRGPAEEKEVEEEDDEEVARRHVTIEPGWYLYDLNSTHGTFLNKQRLAAKTYVRVRVGYMIKLGSSSRSYILTGPAEDEDAPSEMSITEMKELREKQLKLREEMAEIERQERERIEKLKEEEGVSWGMGEDADEETDLAHNPYAMSNNEELFLDDPKKTLRGYFEREGHEHPEYKLEELSAGSYVCRVELPVDDDFGRPIVAEASHKGKKKEVVVQCALEACRILDRYGLLRQAMHEPRRRHKKTSDSDDDDDYLDRTGDVERRRQRKQTKASAEVHTYEDLIRQESELLEKLEDIETRLQRRQLIEKGTRLPENDEDVDEFLEKLSDDKPYDKFEVRRLRLEKERLTKDHVTLQKLIKIAKPLDLPSMSGLPGSSGDGKDQLKKKMLPLFGKRNKLSASFGIKKSEIKVGGSTSAHGEEVEEDEEDDGSAAPPKKEGPKQVVEPAPAPKRVHGPSFNPNLLEQHRKKVVESSDPPPPPPAKEPKKRKSEADCEEPAGSAAEGDANSSSKKKRNRNRAGRERNRDNVDFDDSEELQSEDKNVEWVPPEGQSGDGITSLNQKYGY